MMRRITGRITDSRKILFLGMSCCIIGTPLYSNVEQAKPATKKPRTSSLTELKKHVVTLLEEHYKNIQTGSTTAKEELVAVVNNNAELLKAELYSIKGALADIKNMLQEPATEISESLEQSEQSEPAQVSISEEIKDPASEEIEAPASIEMHELNEESSEEENSLGNTVEEGEEVSADESSESDKASEAISDIL